MADGSPEAERTVDVVAVLHVLAGLLVLVGVLVTLFRPLAPPLVDLPEASRWFDPAHLAHVAAYRRPLQIAALFGFAVRIAIPLLAAFTPFGRRVVAGVVERVGDHRPARAAATVVVGVLLVSDVVLAPLAFWAGYLHEGAFGFRTQGLGGWAYDWFAVRIPSWIAAGVLVLVGYTLARRLPRSWAPTAALSGAALTALVVFAAPYLLEPLRFSMEPLGPGALRDEIVEVAASGERVDRILIADASRRTTKHNAYISGLGGTRRIVLYDTLVADFTPQEVAIVVAHELGHHTNADLPRGVLLGGAGVVLVVYLLAGVLRRRVSLRRQRSVTDPRAAAVVLALVVVLNAVSLPVQAALSRRAEAAADYAALELTGDPETYIAKTLTLSRASLSDPDPPWWVYALWYSHPTAIARLTMGERWPLQDNEP